MTVTLTSFYDEISTGKGRVFGSCLERVNGLIVTTVFFVVFTYLVISGSDVDVEKRFTLRI